MIFDSLFGIGSSVTFTWILLVWNCHGYDRVKRNTVISIGPSNFEAILNSKRPFLLSGDGNENRRRFLLKSFSFYLIYFDFRNESDPSFDQLKRICTQTANYNLKRFGTTVMHGAENYKLRILISVVPQGTFKEKVELVVSIINEVNTMFNGTIYAIIINYRYQRLGIETLPLVNQDISVSHHIFQNVSIPNVLIGISLDLRNCYDSGRHFRNLNLKFLSMIIFTAPFNDDFSRSIVMSCLARHVDMSHVKAPERIAVRPSLIFASALPVYAELSLHDQTFGFNRTYAENLKEELGHFDVSILRAETSEYHINLTTDPVMKTVASQERWLRRDTYFYTSFTGISISNDYVLAHFAKILSLMWRSFCKIFVHEPSMQANSVFKLQSLVANIFDNMAMLKSAQKWNKVCDISSTELFIALTAPLVLNQQWVTMNNATLLSLKTAMSKCPETSTTVLYSWNGCLGQKICSEGNHENIYLHNESEIIPSFVATTLQNSRRLVNNIQIIGSIPNQFHRQPRLGVMLHWSYCRELVNRMRSQDFRPNDDLVAETVEAIVFKLHVHKTEIMQRGALQASSRTIGSLQLCSSLMKVIAPSHIKGKSPRTFPIVLHVTIFGCDANSSNLTELAQVSRYWELMSQWAASVETTIILGPSFEDSTTTTTNCSNKATYYDSISRCGCGCWRMHNSTAGHDFVFETKKSIALKVFEAKHNPKPGNGVRNEGFTADILTQVLVPLLATSALIVCASLVSIWRYKSRQRLCATEIEEFFKGRISARHAKSTGNVDISDEALHWPYDVERYELSPPGFQVDYSRSLGGGEFGAVYRGIVKRNSTEINVAVKMPRNFGDHPNVVQFVGAYTEKLQSGKLLVFLELCELGSLLNYLRDFPNKSFQTCPENNCRDTLHDELSQDLYQWSKEIAYGMKFLASKKIVHGDLAARNVLLNSGKCAKISDFGLARRLYDYSEYLKQEAGPLPWKWMAPESLRRVVFNEKSDVWAFGVTLWEMFSLGDEPYPGLSWQPDFPDLLATGLRLYEPRHTLNNMYDVMNRCWNMSPESRPSFAELSSILDEPIN